MLKLSSYLAIFALLLPLTANPNGTDFKPIFDFGKLENQPKETAPGDTVGWLRVPEVKYKRTKDGDLEIKEKCYVLVEVKNADTPSFGPTTKKVNFTYVNKVGEKLFPLPRGLYKWLRDEKRSVVRHRPYDYAYVYDNNVKQYVKAKAPGAAGPSEPWPKKFKITNWALHEIIGKSIKSATRWKEHERHPSAHFDGLIYKPNLFEWVMGLDEPAFRNHGIELYQAGNKQWQPKFQFKTDDPKFSNRKFVSQGKFKILSTKDILDRIDQKPAFDQHGYIRIIEHDENNPKASDIRAFQADPQFKNATFGIASTAEALEGGMYLPKASLYEMNYSPAQGEEASMGAMAATIYRRYYHGRIRLESHDEQPQSVGLHQGVQVLGDYHPLPKGVTGDPRRHEEYLYSKLVTDKTQTINQVFAFALDMREGETFDRVTKALKEKNITLNNKVVLEYSLAGIILGALEAKSQEVIIPLIGLGAFNNDPDDFLNTFETLLSEYIIKKKMRVNIVYRPNDKLRTWKSPYEKTFLVHLKEFQDTTNKRDGMMQPPKFSLTSLRKPTDQKTSEVNGKILTPTNLAALLAIAAIGTVGTIAYKKGWLKKLRDYFSKKPVEQSTK